VLHQLLRGLGHVVESPGVGMDEQEVPPGPGDPALVTQLLERAPKERRRFERARALSSLAGEQVGQHSRDSEPRLGPCVTRGLRGLQRRVQLDRRVGEERHR
jgi:hypothetical protein